MKFRLLYFSYLKGLVCAFNVGKFIVEFAFIEWGTFLNKYPHLTLFSNEISFDFSNDHDHSPNMFILFVLCNFKLLELNIYTTEHKNGNGCMSEKDQIVQFNLIDVPKEIYNESSRVECRDS